MCDSHVSHLHSVVILQGRQQAIVRPSVEICVLWNGGFSLVREQMQVSSLYSVGQLLNSRVASNVTLSFMAC